MSGNSTNDSRHKHPYLIASNWLNPEWHYWETSRYTEKGKQYLRRAIVEVALKEVEKKDKTDLINWSVK